MTARKLLGPNVIGALNIYRINCKNQSSIPWDKSKDWDRIARKFHEQEGNAGMESVAGTFWFSFYKAPNRKVVRVDAHTDPRMCIRLLKKGEKC